VSDTGHEETPSSCVGEETPPGDTESISPGDFSHPREMLGFEELPLLLRNLGSASPETALKALAQCRSLAAELADELERVLAQRAFKRGATYAGIGRLLGISTSQAERKYPRMSKRAHRRSP
jgi:hypothetical protein